MEFQMSNPSRVLDVFYGQYNARKCSNSFICAYSFEIIYTKNIINDRSGKIEVQCSHY